LFKQIVLGLCSNEELKSHFRMSSPGSVLSCAKLNLKKHELSNFSNPLNILKTWVTPHHSMFYRASQKVTTVWYLSFLSC